MRYLWWLLFSYKGRIGRITFVTSWITWALIFIGLGAIDMNSIPIHSVIAMILFVILIVYPIVPIMVKRLHDTGRSAWYLFIACIPLVGVLWLLAICLFSPGSDKTAEYYCREGTNKIASAEFGLALKNFNRAIRLEPDYSIAYAQRSIAHKFLGNYKKALHDIDHAIRISPEDKLLKTLNYEIYYQLLSTIDPTFPEKFESQRN